METPPKGPNIWNLQKNLDCGSNIFIFTLPGEMMQFDEHIFQMGWFNHQLEKHGE